MFTKKEIETRLWNNSCVEVSLEEFSSWEELSDYVEENNMCNEDVIYYASAINYLSNEDPSLTESLEIASEYGYTADALNSEVLATLLKSQRNRDAFYNMEDELTEYFDSLEEED